MDGETHHRDVYGCLVPIAPRSKTGRGGHLSGMQLDSGSATAESLVEEIRTALWQNLARSSDLMRELDTDGSGTIGVGELRRALLNLGLSPSSEVCQQLFDSLDEDGSGQIDFKELHKRLRRKPDSRPRVSPRNSILPQVSPRQRTGKATVAGPEEPHSMQQSKWSLTELPTWDEDDEREAELLLMPAPAPPAPRGTRQLPPSPRKAKQSAKSKPIGSARRAGGGGPTTVHSSSSSIGDSIGELESMVKRLAGGRAGDKGLLQLLEENLPPDLRHETWSSLDPALSPRHGADHEAGSSSGIFLTSGSYLLLQDSLRDAGTAGSGRNEPQLPLSHVVPHRTRTGAPVLQPAMLPPPPAPPTLATIAQPPHAPPAPPTSRPWDEHVASGATGGMGDAEYSLEQEKMLELYGKILQQYERHVAQMNGNEIRLLRETRRIRTARRPGMASQLRGLQERTAKQVARDEERERQLEAQLQLRLRRLRELGVKLSESELRLRFGLAPGFDADAEEARQMSIERQLELARAAEVAQAEALLAAQSQLGALTGEKARLQQQAEAERKRLMHEVESERARIAELERLREEERLAAERAKALLVSNFDAEREALLERLREAERLLNEKLARDLAHDQAMQQAAAPGERLEKSLAKRGVNTKIQDVDELREAIVTNQSRISDLFRVWDADGNGTVDLQEFTRALTAVGLPADPKAAEVLFREFDVDGSGNVEYKEYLRYSLREMLQRSAARVMDLLHKLDPTGRGAVDLPDFIKGVKQMGYDASDEDLTMLFNEWDSNRSGLLEFKELNAQMRRTGGSKGQSLTKQAAQLISRTKKNMITSAVTGGAVAGFSTVASAAGVVIVETVVASPSQAC